MTVFNRISPDRDGGLSPFRRAGAAFVALGFLLLALGVVALDPRAAAAKGPEIIGTSGRALVMEINKGRLIRIDKPASTVFIADPAIADVQVKSPNLIYVFGKRAGETTLFAVDETDNVLVNMHVTVNHNLSGFRRTLRQLLPGRDIKVRSAGDALVLSGSVKSAADAEQARRIAAHYVRGARNVINTIEVDGPNQVNLRVRVVEVSRQVMRDLGINWDIAITAGNFVFGLATGNPTTILATGAALTRAGSVNNFFTNFNSGNKSINNLIDALETEGLVKTLAQPNLTAISGESASFLAGGEFPIVVPQPNGTFAVEFKQFGISLSFTPTIISPTRINLKVAPEVSQLSTAGAVTFQGFTIPALTTRRANTTVELASGQSFAIAGLLQNRMTHDVSKVPGLGDIPILGRLFRSDQYQRNESELVIIITPVIVKPFNAEMASAARSRTVQGSTRILPGASRRGQSRTGGPPAPQLRGPAGFELE